MKFNSNKEKGNTGLGIAIAYYSANGYTVSIPLNDTQDYDFIVDKDNILKKIQVKATSCKTKYNKYQVALKSCGGTKGGTYKTVVDTNIDEVFIVTGKAVERLMGRINIEDNESMYYLQKSLRNMGIEEQLKEMGICEGDTVIIAGWEMEWYE